MARYHGMLGGHKIPSVGYGTAGLRSEDVLKPTINEVLETGYRHIDAAEAYDNEALLGKVLNSWFTSGKIKREDIFITTKLKSTGIHPDRVESFLKESLEKLHLKYVDLFLIHGPIGAEERGKEKVPIPTDHIAIWKKMEEQVDAGRVKEIGVSNFNAQQIEKIWQSARIKPSCLQIEIHPYFQQKELTKYCHDKNIVVVGYSCIRSPPPNVQLPSIFNNETIKQISEKYKRSPAQVVLRFFIQKNIIVIPKSVTPSRIRDNFDLFSFSLSSEDVKILEGLDKGEEGRFQKMDVMHPKIKDHPEYPYTK